MIFPTTKSILRLIEEIQYQTRKSLKILEIFPGYARVRTIIFTFHICNTYQLRLIYKKKKMYLEFIMLET